MNRRDLLKLAALAPLCGVKAPAQVGYFVNLSTECMFDVGDLTDVYVMEDHELIETLHVRITASTNGWGAVRDGTGDVWESEDVWRHDYVVEGRTKA